MPHARVHHRRAGPQGTRHPRRSRRRSASPTRRTRSSRPAVVFSPAPPPATVAPTAPSCTSRTVRPFNEGLLVGFAEIPDRTAAELWRGRYLLLPADELPPPDEDEVYLHELARHARRARRSGELVGTVDELYELPQGLALDVRRAEPREGETVMRPVRRPHRRVGRQGRARHRRHARPRGCSSEDQRRHDLPRFLHGAARASASRRAPRRRGGARTTSSTCATTRTTGTARWTTRPYGGGAGMVMKPEPFFEAVEALGADGADRADERARPALRAGATPCASPRATS